ncbi:nucleotidyltransferase family protein [Sphingobium nicotianae]|uniref:Nucleotidyltransferase family protein n=1 Tax=Sphingobium nicotianae TaxID=2782607 RepID=A0A9X1AI24_9SPHN|nr:nucleotidyltransferase family protein [Sphingobium nicotianae]
MARAEGLAVALLAAGRSTRFGVADKLLAQLGDRPLIKWAADAGLSVGADHRFLVAGDDFDADTLGYRLCPNPHPEHGMATSLRIAATAAREAGASALLILLADMPFVTAAHLARLVATFLRDSSAPVFSTAEGGTPQPPSLFPASLFAALQALEGDKGARSLAVGATLVVAGADALLDVDTPDDLDSARQSIL